MEEMIRRAHKMEELVDYDSLSLFPNARLPPKFKMPNLDKFDGTNFLPIYNKYLFAQYFPNFKALIAARTQIEDAINNGTIKTDDLPRFRKNLGINSKAVEVSNIHKNDPY